MFWYVGETRYASSVVSSLIGASFVIDSATYSIIDTSDDSVVASGVANVNSHTIYILWTPAEVGTFVVDFSYIIGVETFSSRQVIDIRETL